MENNYDLIPYPDEVKTIFILESPHSDELENKYPVAGQTGKNMSRNILDDDQIPFGKLLMERDSRIKNYGVFNTCHFPLGKPELLEGRELEIAAIKFVHQTDDRYDNYRRMSKFLNTIENIDEIINYKSRLSGILINHQSIETLVICGFIAQSISIKIYPKFGSPDLPMYNTPGKIENDKGRKIMLHFVNHPSELNGQKWDYIPK
ncbi:MAG: hypothetical protein V4622_07620 [Bacteroidota bacterium]